MKPDWDSRQLLMTQVGKLIRENEHAARTARALEQQGLTPVGVREELARLLLGVMWEVAVHGVPPSRFDDYLDRLIAGERAVDIWPEK